MLRAQNALYNRHTYIQAMPELNETLISVLITFLFHLTLIECVSIFIEGHTPDRDIQQTTVIILIPISHIHRLVLCTQQ